MHFLTKEEVHQVESLRKPHAGRKVEFRRRGTDRILVACSPAEDEPVTSVIFVVKLDTQLVVLPKSVIVVDEEDVVLRPTWGFWVTVETFNPYHVLLDWRDGETMYKARTR